MSELTTPLLIIKKNLLQAGLFLGCIERCYFCAAQPNRCQLLKEGIQRLMENHMILVEKTTSVENLFQDLELEEVSILSGTLIRITSKGPVRITSKPKVAPLIITSPGLIPYSSDKAIPWNYGSDVYYHRVKQELSTTEYEGTEVTEPDIDTIAGTSKVTRRRKVVSPEIAMKTVATLVRVTATE